MSEELKTLDVKGQSVDVSSLNKINLKGLEIEVPKGGEFELIELTISYDSIQSVTKAVGKISITDYTKLYLVCLTYGIHAQFIYSGSYPTNSNKTMTLFSEYYYDTSTPIIKDGEITIFANRDIEFYRSAKYVLLVVKE